MEAILLYALPYKITDEKTGEVNSGLSLWFHGSGDLSPEEQKNGSTVVKGSKPLKLSLPYDQEHKIVAAPGVYKLYTKLSAGRNNVASLQLKDIEYIGQAKLTIEKAKEQPKAV